MLSLLFLRIHTAQTRIAQLQPHFPAAARYRLHQLFQKMVQRTFLIRRQQTLAVDMFLDQMADTRIFAWFDRRKSAGEFCIGCCCFPAKTGIYAPQTKILVNSCFRSPDPPARPLLLLFLCRRSKADDPRRLRRISRREGAMVMPIAAPAAMPMVMPRKNFPYPHPFIASSRPFPHQNGLFGAHCYSFRFRGKMRC